MTQTRRLLPPSPRSRNHRHGRRRGAGLPEQFGDLAAGRAGRQHVVDQQHSRLGQVDARPQAKGPAHIEEPGVRRQAALGPREAPPHQAAGAARSPEMPREHGAQGFRAVGASNRPPQPVHGRRQNDVGTPGADLRPGPLKQQFGECGRQRLLARSLHPQHRGSQLASIVTQYPYAVEGRRPQPALRTTPGFVGDRRPAAAASSDGRAEQARLARSARQLRWRRGADFRIAMGAARRKGQIGQRAKCPRPNPPPSRSARLSDCFAINIRHVSLRFVELLYRQSRWNSAGQGYWLRSSWFVLNNSGSAAPGRASPARIYPGVSGPQAETPFRSQKNNLANFMQIIQKFAFSQETR